MTPQEAIEIITNAVQGDGTKITAEQDEALAFVQKTIEKQMAKKPYQETHLNNPFGERYTECICPSCGRNVDNEEHHCKCGQALDWS